MKYAPSLPPPVSGVEERREVLALAPVKPSKRVQARTLPPLLTQRHSSYNGAIAELSRETALEQAREISAEPAQENEKREFIQESRRKYCRRVSHQSMLEELRSGQERRKNRQRGSDTTEHIDEQV